MAKIQLNGKKISIRGKLSVFNLLNKYKLKTKKVAIEINGTILLKAKHKSYYLKDNDKVEIVHFIGGG
tara:strand:+ start:278 stop:481 length:204 start_codon:yes stop_codon:yes gene_type:complete